MEKENDEIFSDITLLNMKQVMTHLNISQWVYYKLEAGRCPGFRWASGCWYG